MTVVMKDIMSGLASGEIVSCEVSASAEKIHIKALFDRFQYDPFDLLKRKMHI